MLIMTIITREDTVLCTLNCNFDSCYHISASYLIDYMKLSLAGHSTARHADSADSNRQNTSHSSALSLQQAIYHVQAKILFTPLQNRFSVA